MVDRLPPSRPPRFRSAPDRLEEGNNPNVTPGGYPAVTTRDIQRSLNDTYATDGRGVDGRGNGFIYNNQDRLEEGINPNVAQPTRNPNLSTGSAQGATATPSPGSLGNSVFAFDPTQGLFISNNEQQLLSDLENNPQGTANGIIDVVNAIATNSTAGLRIFESTEAGQPFQDQGVDLPIFSGTGGGTLADAVNANSSTIDITQRTLASFSSTLQRLISTNFAPDGQNSSTGATQRNSRIIQAIESAIQRITQVQNAIGASAKVGQEAAAKLSTDANKDLGKAPGG